MWRSLVLLTLGAASRGTLAAQMPGATPNVDSETVAAFGDRFFPSEMAKRHIPGAVFVVVTRDRLLVARGYGAASIDPYRPVDPARTRFRLASVSKTITATAVMQLVEDGRVDLTRDVNAYLRGFRIKADRGVITLHNLLTHTAGFEERLTGIAALQPADVIPLAEYVRRCEPPTFAEPGRVISYSNYGYTLAGLIVEQVSGLPFTDYVRKRIFEPLGMGASGAFDRPAQPEDARAYEFRDGRYVPLAPEYMQTSPAGTFFTTGLDMARFLMAHLENDGHGPHVLTGRTLSLMHALHFRQEPAMSGWAYGLWEDTRDGTRALLHNGGGKGYRALFYLLPDLELGFFVAYNLADRHPEGELQEVLIDRFRREFVPMTPVRSQGKGSEPAIDRTDLAGDYWYVRRARTTVEKIIGWPNQVHVRVSENRTLYVSGVAPRSAKLIEENVLTFRDSGGHEKIGFERGPDGRASRLVMVAGSGFPAVYERLPWSASRWVQAFWIGVVLLGFLFAIVRSIAALVRGGLVEESSSVWLLRSGAALGFVFLVAFPPAFVGRIEGGVPAFAYGLPKLAAILLWAPALTGLLTLASIIASARNTRRWGMRRRTPKEVWIVGVSTLAFLALTAYWRALGPFGL